MDNRVTWEEERKRLKSEFEAVLRGEFCYLDESPHKLAEHREKIARLNRRRFVVVECLEKLLKRR